MKLSKAEIRREIEKISSSYSPDEIFSSTYFYQIIQAVVTSACEALKRIPMVKAFCDSDDNFTACTEGSIVRINTLGPLIRERDTNWEKYVNIVGHTIHECGHVLFTDFIEFKKLMDGWTDKEFTFYPKKPDIDGIDSDEIAKYLDEHPNYKRMFLYEMKNIQNIMEDVYIENCLFDAFDGVATLGLAKSREELYRQGPIETEIFDRVLSGEISPLIAFSQILLGQRTGYPAKQGEHLNDEQKDVRDLIYSYLDMCDEEIDRLKWEPNGKKRCEMLNRILVKVKPLLPEPPDNEDMEDPNAAINEMIKKLLDQLSEEGEEGGNTGESNDDGQSSSDYSDEAADQQTSTSGQMSKDAGMSAVPQGNSRPVNSKAPDQQETEQSKRDAQKKADSDEACKHQFEQAVKEMATSEFEDKDEQQHSSELQEEANQIKAEAEQGRGAGGQSTEFRVDRIDVGDNQRQTYNEVFAEVATTSRHLSKKLSNLLKDREQESCDSGYLMGQRFNARDVVHNDGKYFSRISVPDGKLRVCFGILVDESGSMYGRKTESARRATILLEDTLRNLNVPFMICGHTTGWSDEVLIRSFVDFDTNDGKDRYRLADITAMYGNTDGGAITYVGEKLLKRPEEQKVLIVISDGQPSGTSFYSYDYNEDTTMAVNYYRKKGINVFGAVVDEWELVSRLYGEQYSFDCRNGQELERQLIRLVKKYVKTMN